MFQRPTIKATKLLAFHLFCLTVILTFLANIARAEDVVKPAKAQTQPSQSALFIHFANGLLTVDYQDIMFFRLSAVRRNPLWPALVRLASNMLLSP